MGSSGNRLGRMNGFGREEDGAVRDRIVRGDAVQSRQQSQQTPVSTERMNGWRDGRTRQTPGRA
jgi:hypothetical protein